MAIIRGQAQLNRTLSTLARAPAKSLDSACVESLTPMRDETKANALRLRQHGTPKGGHLDQGVVIAKRQSSGSFYRVFWLSFKARARKIAHLVELGTAPHWQPRWRGGWMHPGARPKPFMRPAYDAHRNTVPEIFGRKVWESIVGSIRGGVR